MAPLESKILTYTHSPSGNFHNLFSKFRPGQGEVWYMDKLVVQNDGTGSHQAGDRMYCYAAVTGRAFESDWTGDDLQYEHLTTKEFRTDYPDIDKVTADTTIGEDETLHVGFYDYNISDPATFYIKIMLRRMV